MLFKLCKMELKQSWRTFIFLFMTLIVSSIFLGLNGVRNEMLNQIVLLVYIASIFTVMILVVVNIVQNFYQSMFSKSAYLTHTLPVTSTQLLLSKLLSGFLWTAISGLVIVFSFFLLAILAAGFAPSLEEWGQIFEVLREVPIEFLLLLTNVAFSYMENILLFFLVMTIVHSCYIRKHRGISGIVIYFVISWIVSYVFNSMIKLPYLDSISFIFGSNFPNFYGIQDFNGHLLISIAIHIVLCCAYFFTTKYFLDYKMEVE